MEAHVLFGTVPDCAMSSWIHSHRACQTIRARGEVLGTLLLTPSEYRYDRELSSRWPLPSNTGPATCACQAPCAAYPRPCRMFHELACRSTPDVEGVRTAGSHPPWLGEKGSQHPCH